MKAAGSRLVLDASVAVAWCFEDEKTPYTELVLNQMAKGAEALVPAIWPFEISNALLAAERRQWISAPESSFFLDLLSHLNIRPDDALPAHVFGVILSEARRCQLTVYDAAYLELARRHSVPLATSDANMTKAAKLLGIPTAYTPSKTG